MCNIVQNLVTFVVNTVEEISVKYDPCSMNINPNCGTRYRSSAETVKEMATGYAAYSAGGMTQEDLDRIYALADATERLAAINTLLGSWPVNSIDEPYPLVIDPRTGEPITPSPGNLQIVPGEERVPPLGASGRDAFIHEWDRRGYAELTGGWELYDIHHIIPRQYGGTNDFDNLVPILRKDIHQQQFSSWWSNYQPWE